MRKGKKILLCNIAIFSILVSGCATVRNPLPENMLMRATVNNMSDIRAYLGVKDSQLQRNLLDSFKQENPKDYPAGSDGAKVYPVIAISGGAANGAYGAGLLKGWSVEGSRPKFKVVTGVSTGAITAPFVFLGKEYDEDLEKLYTTISTKNVMFNNRLLKVIFGDALANTKPLKQILNEIVTYDMLNKIAAEHRAGRRLYVGTTNLDEQKFIVWDLGAIAAKGDKKLFCDVILASAAIPIMFPPVFIATEIDGQKYDEMHVDGGTITQAFTVYQLIDPLVEEIKASGVDLTKFKAKYYVLRNGYVQGKYDKVRDNVASIATRAMDTIIGAQGIGDTYRIYTEMLDRRNEFYLAYIPSDFRPSAKEGFDPQQMKQLFEKGYQDAIKGYKWYRVPPGME